MGEGRKTVSAIVVTYNGAKWIEKCIGSLLFCKDCSAVIVVDNCSSDNTVEIVEATFPEVRVIRSKENLGFGAANNIGMKMALEEGADYVFLLNQDAWLLDDQLGALVSIHSENPGFGILSPLQLDGSGKAIDFKFAGYLSSSIEMLNDLICNNGNIRSIYEVNFANAAAWLIPRHWLQTVGGFDSVFYHYGEDRDYVQRLQYHGGKVGVCPKVRVAHDRSQTPSKNLNENIKFELAYILLECKNCRDGVLSQLTCMGMVLRRSLRYLCSSMSKRQFSLISLYRIMKLSLMLRRVRVSRSLCKTPGAHFLSRAL